MKEKWWHIYLTDGTDETFFASIRWTDTMLTVYEYDFKDYIEYNINERENPNKPIRLIFYPLHNIRSYWADA